MERPLYSANAKYATSLLRKSISANPTGLINPLRSPEKTTFSMTPTDPSGVDTSTYPTFATSPEIAGRDYSVRNSKVSGVDVSGPGDKTNNARYENYLKDRFDKESNDTTPNDDSLNYRHKYGQGKIAKDSEETFNDYFVNNYPDKSPVSLSNLVSLNSNTDIPHSTKATHSRTNDPIAVAPSPISTLTTTASVTIATPTTIAATAPSIVTTTTPSTTTTHFIERGKCLASCKGVPDGDYQSCFSCHFYITCSNGFLWDNRPCPSNLVWDDLLQMCVHVSTTCHVQVIRR
ncbi:uncharacterized protein LOC112557334 [Pomacea canaliculata]|uniref:uncharacterized protein LOC112557334 n=1 Tax=Pomacea canaliculata TaxID=400727 RepID=UPI000D726037|nr:uncharacterized protein LOC112557334 [Pomacea canaliculata]